MLRYNATMDAVPKTPSETTHDTTLIDWFLSLPPAERLAELDSRVAFFRAVRSANGNTELPTNTGAA